VTKRLLIALAAAAVLLGLAVSGLPVIAQLAWLVLVAWLVLALGWATWPACRATARGRCAGGRHTSRSTSRRR
jgi:hypothetical protein